jgi:Uma2 family endonuclease
MAVQPVTKILTAEELMDLPEDGFRYELVKGELVKMTPTGLRHGRIAMRLGSRLEQHASKHNLGSVYAAETGFLLASDPDTVRAPDASFVAAGRIPPEGEPDKFGPFAPDLAVEVISPSDRVVEVEEKVMEYLEAGTRLVWVVNPNAETVTEYRSLTQVRILTSDDVLEGGDVLPGFKCPVREIF